MADDIVAQLPELRLTAQLLKEMVQNRRTEERIYHDKFMEILPNLLLAHVLRDASSRARKGFERVSLEIDSSDIKSLMVDCPFLKETFGECDQIWYMCLKERTAICNVLKIALEGRGFVCQVGENLNCLPVSLSWG
jgi:hypothetical protein